MQRMAALTLIGLLTITIFPLPIMEEASAQTNVDLIVGVSRSGSSDRAVTSPDGDSWTARSTTNRNWWDVTYSEDLGLFVAIGADGWTMRSSDGVTWTETQVSGLGAATSNIVDITFAESLFVATGDEFGSANCANCLATSPDGSTWTIRNGGAADAVVSTIAHDGDSFLALGFDGVQVYDITSPDGVTWTQDTTNLGGTFEPSGLAFGAGVWVSVANAGSSDRIQSSTDGNTWTARSGDNTIIWQDIIYDGTRFVAVGTSRISTSTDGITWNTQTVSGAWTGVTRIEALGEYVAIASTNGDIATSPNGVTWTVESGALPNTNAYEGVANGFATPNCPATQDCTATTSPSTSFTEVRTSYNPFFGANGSVAVYVREKGLGATNAGIVGTSGDPPASGYMHYFGTNLTNWLQGEDLSNDSPRNYCYKNGQTGSTEDSWYVPDDNNFKGFTASPDNELIIHCMQRSLTSSDLARGISVGFSPGSSQKTDGPNEYVTIARMDAYNSNTIIYSTIQNTYSHYDHRRGDTGDFYELGVLGGIAIDPINGYSAAVGSDGLNIHFTASNIASPPIADSTNITGNAVAVNATNVWVAHANGLNRYTWDTSDTFTSSATNANMKVSTPHGYADIRLSKDQDYIFSWNAATVRIAYASNLSQVYSSTLSDTIRSCDMDPYNNYLFCVTENTVERLYIADDITTVQGLTKDGLTSEDNETVQQEIIENNNNPSTGSTGTPGAGGTVENPGAEGGFLSDAEGEDFFGVPLQPVADNFGTSLTAIKWLMGIFLVAWLSIGIGRMVGTVGVLIGAAAGLGMGTAFGYFPIWFLLFIILIISLLLGKMLFRDETGGGV